MRRIRIIISLLALLMMLFIGAYPTAIAATDGVVVSTEEELLAAIDELAALVIIDADIPLTQAVIVEHHLTIRGQGVITVSDNHRHFEIKENGHLILDGDIILTRAPDYDGNGGSVSVTGGTFTFNSGEISNNRTFYGGGIYVTYSGGTYTPDDGVIGITHGSVHLNGGAIRQNHAVIGGGIYLDRWSELTMHGGSIEENTAETVGGGIFIQSSSLYLIRGTIQNNHAAGHGGVYISATTRYQIRHRMRIEGNTPINRHEMSAISPVVSWYDQLITPMVIHLLALLAIAGVGMLIAKKKSGSKSPQ